MQKSLFNFQIEAKDTNFREGTGISNLDGRLWDEVGRDTARFFGDEAMVRARIGIEARYLIALSKAKVIRKLSERETNILLKLHTRVTAKEYGDLRKIENKIHHDVIAMIEIFKNLLKNNNKLIRDLAPWIHWGLTTYDLDDTAKAILVNNFLCEIFLPQISKLLKSIVNLSEKTSDVVIQGKTHLQPAVPTLMGKEIALFGLRIAQVTDKINNFKLNGKLTGAVGNLAAQKSVYPKIDWLKFSKNFIESLGLKANLFTTQIDSKDNLVELLGLIKQINLILIDLSQDMRLYIGFDWLVQETKKEEFGSSAMPQKVNPIDFENSQGNALLSNWLLEGLIRTLPVSWLQRDLVDKTILRNLGLPFGYSLIALISAGKGLSRVIANETKINSDLESDWSILSEAYQVSLRAMGIPEGYEELKKLTRGKKLGKEDINNWIKGLKSSEEVKDRLRKIDFDNYTGYARQNLKTMLKNIRKSLLQISS